MKYTPEQLKEMSKLAINELVAKIIKRDYVLSNLNSNDNYLWCEDREEEIDYCNNPNDIMPIAFENGIGLTRIYGDRKSWYATYDDGDGTWESKINSNPLRAICELFILMNQGDES